MFEAIRRGDHTSLRTLAKTFGNDPAALLCLDHVFSSPLKLRNIPLVEAQASLSLYLDYIHLLTELRRNESSAEGSNHQRLFGFKVLRGRGRYLVLKHTLLHEELVNRSGPSGKSTDACECSYDEIRRVIVHFVSGRIDYRTEIQDRTCRSVGGFSPCLPFLVQKKCGPQGGKGICSLQHVQPEQLTVDWYHARLHLILLQFQILDSAHCEKLDVKRYAPRLSPQEMR